MVGSRRGDTGGGGAAGVLRQQCESSVFLREAEGRCRNTRHKNLKIEMIKTGGQSIVGGSDALNGALMSYSLS